MNHIRKTTSEYDWVNTISQQMLNGDNELRDAMPLSPCTIEDITVDNQFNKSVLNVKAEMQVSPYGRINIVNGYI